MTSSPEVPAPEAIAGHHQQSRQRRRRGVRLIGGILLGFVLLIVCTPLLLFLAWNSRGRSLLRAELAQIKAAGQPITTAEMVEYYKLPAGTPDITDIWVAAIAPFDTPQYNAASENLPIVGNNTVELPPLDQPLSADDEQAIRDWITLHQQALAGLYAATRTPGEVRFPRDFRKGMAMLVPEVWQMRNGVHALALEFEVLAREDELTPAFENLEASFIAGETIRHEPFLVSMLARSSSHYVVRKNVGRLAETNRLSDAELARLQALVRKIDLHGQMDDALLGERATCYHAFHLDMGVMPNLNDTYIVPRETSHDARNIKRPEDCAMSLKFLRQMHDAAEQPVPDFLEACEEIQADIKQLKGDSSPMNRFRYVVTMLLLPDIVAAGTVDANGEALRDLTDAALAVRRYHLKHGQPPQTLANLVPDFLPRVPIDPFDGQSLRLTSREDKFILYSIGRDRRDDGGVFDLTQTPDIGVEVKLPTAE